MAQIGTLLGITAWQNGYGRDLEDQADRVGLRYAYEGGFDVRQMPMLLLSHLVSQLLELGSFSPIGPSVGIGQPESNPHQELEPFPGDSPSRLSSSCKNAIVFSSPGDEGPRPSNSSEDSLSIQAAWF